MKLIRYKAEGFVQYGVVEGDYVKVISGCIFDQYTITSQTYSVTDIEILAPVQPTNLIAVGKSYRNHIDEMAARHGSAPDYPIKPIIFFEAPGSVTPAGAPIILPDKTTCPHVDLEGELAIVIGKRARNITVDQALEYVLGYTIVNDVSARGLKDIGGLWGIGLSKSLDTFTPMGPVIETEIEDPNRLQLVTRVNGVVTQDTNTSDMLFTVQEYVSYCSSRFTLLPGDVIMTGTPAGVRPIDNGDVVEISIEEIGTLKNPVIREDL